MALCGIVTSSSLSLNLRDRFPGRRGNHGRRPTEILTATGEAENGHMNNRIIFLAVACIAIGCADGEDLEYQSTGDPPPGPGIVTGIQGAIIIEFGPEKKTSSGKQADRQRGSGR